MNIVLATIKGLEAGGVEPLFPVIVKTSGMNAEAVWADLIELLKQRRVVLIGRAYRLANGRRSTDNREKAA